MTDMDPTTDVAQWPGMGAGKGFLARSESGELALEVWKTDPAGAPTHGEVREALGYSFDAVLASFAIENGELKVYEDDDVHGTYRLIVELDPRLGLLELKEGWNFE
jgi:hypothetical protein